MQNSQMLKLLSSTLDHQVLSETYYMPNTMQDIHDSMKSWKGALCLMVLNASEQIVLIKVDKCNDRAMNFLNY